MQVTLEIPDDVAKEYGDTPGIVGRKMLEQFALDGYNARRFGQYKVRLLLGFNSWMETDNFLRENHAPLQYDIEDLEADIKTYREVFGNREPSHR